MRRCGKNEVRIAYAIDKADLKRAIFLLGKAHKAGKNLSYNPLFGRWGKYLILHVYLDIWLD